MNQLGEMLSCHGSTKKQILNTALGKVVGHYTQVVNSEAIKIGCGGAINDNSKTIIIACNYGVGQSNIENPYKTGSPCSNCGNCFNETLCNCNKLCQNFGVLDLLTCKCNCPGYASGDECENLNCNKTDQEYGCQALDKLDWCVFSNIKPACPHMCGLCTL
ncbi:cysteine-rich venom Mr30-like [Brachionus plicatilis]|uniref:Cysteine-rich venom Mr30-like n=1 Tax=Brachionus plicatilis TaxID=10195 RepID=A0A3M7S1L5_BRAPC|nr:cysteine-rich venom Mr30-like [Brachionus plicatilis]